MSGQLILDEKIVNEFERVNESARANSVPDQTLCGVPTIGSSYVPSNSMLSNLSVGLFVLLCELGQHVRTSNSCAILAGRIER